MHSVGNRGGYGPWATRATALGVGQNISYNICKCLAQFEVALGVDQILPAQAQRRERDPELLHESVCATVIAPPRLMPRRNL